MKTYILVVTKPGTSENVVKAIKDKVKEVVQADSVWGRYDAILTIEAPTLEKITDIVYKIVASHPEIVHTETAIAL
jgi:DNA-binding Lrp family transcriptional regulator